MKPITITDRQTWIARMEAANNMAMRWSGFYDACCELSEVAARSRKFDAAEKKAAIALELVARLEGGMTQVMKDEFKRQYKVLGAPGDFGYDTKEGKAIQAVYEWWNELCYAK